MKRYPRQLCWQISSKLIRPLQLNFGHIQLSIALEDFGSSRSIRIFKTSLTQVTQSRRAVSASLVYVKFEEGIYQEIKQELGENI